MLTATEAIYRDLEYARSLIKNLAGEPLETSEFEAEELSDKHGRRPKSQSVESSNGSRGGAPSEDWSVISDEEGRSVSRSPSKGRSLASKPFHALHDTLLSASSSLSKVL